MIPINIQECFDELDKTLPDDVKQEMQDNNEDYMITFHSDIGRTIRNKWGLWKYSDLAKYFNRQFGIVHADDISGMILTSYWRFKHNKPLELQQLAQYYVDYWEKKQ